MSGPGSHLRITWHVAYDPATIHVAAAQTRACRIARSYGFPVTVTRGVGAVDPWPDEPCLTVTSYVPRNTPPAAMGSFARTLARAFDQSEVVWTEEPITLNTTERNPR